VGLLEDMLSTGLAGGMLPVEFVGVAGCCQWCNGRIDNMPELELDWFDKPVMEKAKDRMESIVDDGDSIAWCG
jgi:hypothetical protein